MIKKAQKISLIFFLLLFSYACNENTKKDKKISQTTTNQNLSTKGKILFFMNPNGGPCQMQENILKSLESDIGEKVIVRRVSTENPKDRSLFYKHGIRGLPLLVLIDANGNIVQRFSPGIIDHKTILKSISNCKC